jgi:hypothetical protein
MDAPMSSRAVVDDLELVDVGAVAAGHVVLEAAAVVGAADGGAVAVQRAVGAVRVRRDGDADGAGLAHGRLVPGAAVGADVELRRGRARRVQAARPVADGELRVGAVAERVHGAAEQVRAVGQRLQRQLQLLPAQVLHRDLPAAGRRRRRGQHGQQRQRHGHLAGQGHRRLRLSSYSLSSHTDC